MVRETKYGMISDIHGDPRIIISAIETLKREGAEKLLVNGDIGNAMPGENLRDAISKSQKYTAIILKSLGECGLETYFQPGSHETILGFDPVAEWACEKYNNLNYISKPSKFEFKDHDLVFLPGSDVNIRMGEYMISNDSISFSGKYMRIGEGKLFEDWRLFAEYVENGHMKGAYSLANMNDLRRLVSNPENTISVCHVPRKFDNLENCVDVAKFCEAKIDFVYRGTTISKGTIIPGMSIEENKNNFPLKVVENNRGNEDLRDLYEELGITKAVSGHFHESSHKANDGEGNHVSENTYVNELFWNSGHLDEGYTGILRVKGSEVSYRNIKLEF